MSGILAASRVGDRAGLVRLFGGLASAAVLAAALGSPAGAQGAPRCAGSQLAASFTRVAGSAGAGNVSYRLALTNVSAAACTLTGLPQGTLLGKTGRALPTHVRAAFPGGLAAVLVRLAPGGTASASARLSPDVPGPGEPAAGRACEPVAYAFRLVAPGGGTARAAIRPPTPVCEHGQLLFSAYGTG